VTYRLGPHSSSDDPSRYRDEREVERWRKRDPLVIYRRYLERLGTWGDESEANLEKEIGDAISEAVREAETHPPPPIDTLFTDVTFEMPAQLEEELEELRRIRGR